MVAAKQGQDLQTNTIGYTEFHQAHVLSLDSGRMLVENYPSHLGREF